MPNYENVEKSQMLCNFVTHPSGQFIHFSSYLPALLYCIRGICTKSDYAV